MKKFLILVLSVLLTALSLVSCQEYDDGDISRVDSLAGIEGTDSLQPAAGTNEKSAEGKTCPKKAAPEPPNRFWKITLSAILRITFVPSNAMWIILPYC